MSQCDKPERTSSWSPAAAARLPAPGSRRCRWLEQGLPLRERDRQPCPGGVAASGEEKEILRLSPSPNAFWTAKTHCLQNPPPKKWTLWIRVPVGSKASRALLKRWCWRVRVCSLRCCYYIVRACLEPVQVAWAFHAWEQTGNTPLSVSVCARTRCSLSMCIPALFIHFFILRLLAMQSVGIWHCTCQKERVFCTCPLAVAEPVHCHSVTAGVPG